MEGKEGSSVRCLRIFREEFIQLSLLIIKSIRAYQGIRQDIVAGNGGDRFWDAEMGRGLGGHWWG